MYLLTSGTLRLFNFDKDLVRVHPALRAPERWARRYSGIYISNTGSPIPMTDLLESIFNARRMRTRVTAHVLHVASCAEKPARAALKVNPLPCLCALENLLCLRGKAS